MNGTATGGATGTGGAGTTVDTAQSVLERNKHPSRDGHFVQPTFTKANAAKIARDTTFTATYAGGVWNNPLYMEMGPGNKGAFFLATLNNDVAAFDETTGAQIWKTNLGAVSSVAPCGGGNSYSTVAVFGTPIIDATTRTLYVANAVGPGAITNFMVHALSVEDGKEKTGWPVDVKRAMGLTDVSKHNQRGALSLVKGILYVPFGGHVGDCQPYQGRVLAIDTTDPTKIAQWATQGERAAIWAPGGMASDGTSVFAVTADGARNPPAAHLPEVGGVTDSESVVRVTGLAVVDRSRANYYYPARWADMDRNDTDFGSNSAVYIRVPGAPKSGYVVAPSKDGHLYFLDATNLGGKDGHVVDMVIANTGMSVYTTTASYTAANGVYVLISTNGAHCPTGGPTGHVIMAVNVPVVNGEIAPKVAWCAAQAGPLASAIATTTDGHSDAIVWYMSNGALVGVDGDSGAPVAAPTGTCAGLQRWTSPIAAKGRILAAGTNLCSWSVP